MLAAKLIVIKAKDREPEAHNMHTVIGQCYFLNDATTKDSYNVSESAVHTAPFVNLDVDSQSLLKAEAFLRKNIYFILATLVTNSAGSRVLSTHQPQ